MPAKLLLTTFRELTGVPVHWGGWGKTGERKLAPAFLERLELALSALWELHPLGRPEAILSGGAYVDRLITQGDRHSTGTAFDLSGMRWSGDELRLSAATREERPGELLQTEACLRLHIPQVLGPWYDRRHLSHWHLDDRADAAWFQSSSASDALFLQASLVHVWGAELKLDGRVGRLTRAAVAEVLDGDVRIEAVRVWRRYLEATAGR